MQRIKRQAAIRARRLLDEQGISTVPVDVIDVAGRLGVRVAAEDLDDDTSAVIVMKGSRAVIGVNRNHHPHRQRFSIAHELGHFLLHANGENVFVDKTLTFYRDEASSEGVYTQEVAANAFAAELLMPESILQGYFQDNTVDVHDEMALRRLAAKFQVSEQALTIRLINLGFIQA